MQIQKLVTIFLCASREGDMDVKEHLNDYLTQGWQIKSVMSVGVSGSEDSSSAWIAVVLEKFEERRGSY